ncbi:hypothetical protein SOVF_158360 [Spinacia oleracea]|nr:hypothetical protein SOVF_158360 [Spinacia oleracea]
MDCSEPEIPYRIAEYLPFPFPPAFQILILKTQENSITTRTPPTQTHPPTKINLKNFYYQGIMGEWGRVWPGLMRDYILNPDKAPHFATDMQMVHPEQSGRLVPAHITNLQDAEDMSEVAAILLRWWMTQHKKEYSPLVVPWELHFLSDPEPMLPIERKTLLLLGIGEWRNGRQGQTM